MKRLIESKDVVRIQSGKHKFTGVVNRICSTTGMVNVFVTQDNPYGIGIWFSLNEMKRIGRVK